MEQRTDHCALRCQWCRLDTVQLSAGLVFYDDEIYPNISSPVRGVLRDVDTFRPNIDRHRQSHRPDLFHPFILPICSRRLGTGGWSSYICHLYSRQ